MKLHNFVIILAIYCGVVLAGPIVKKERAKMPSFVKTCLRSDPNLDMCARKSLLALKGHLKYGIPELYIPPLTPLVVPEVKMDQDSGAIYLHSIFKDITVNGLDDFKINELHIDPEKMTVKMSLSLPKVRMVAKYAMDGKIMMMPLVGEGDFKANLTNVELDTLITAVHYKRHDRLYAKVKDVNIKYTLGDVKVHLSNLFNGDKALGDRMNAFLNENWNSLSNELSPLMEDAIANIVRSSAVKLFDTYSIDDLLPE
ncbi:protein takeout [Eurosta solidaginis]|uniref:protein takeout n=1 Tax=Eurosta solidaginis TaxID=178769 RepID=UPI003530E9E7